MIKWKIINNYLRLNVDEGILEITVSKLNVSMISFIIEYMEKQNINGLGYGSPFEDDKSDITFLTSIPNLRKLGLACSEFSIESVHHLHSLEELSISFQFIGSINFSNFPKLKKVYINWDNIGVESLFTCKGIIDLSIINYNSLTLSEFENFSNLKKINLYDPKLISFNGIGKLKLLEYLKIIGGRKLEDLGDIEELDTLNHLTLHGCSNIQDLSPIMYLKNLRFLNLDTLGPIPSIKFLETLKNLEEFYMTESTNVEDGDLSVLDHLRKRHKLKKVGFANRKHYSHTREQLGYQVPPEVAAIFAKKKK